MHASWLDPNPSREKAISVVSRNLVEYEKLALNASVHGAALIVFPEDGM